jgi:alpha-tubulin suppressor-like RCC1 family protein
MICKHSLCVAIAVSEAVVSVPVVAGTPGIVRCWGSNSYGQSAPPPGLGLVTQVSAGGQHTLALKANGQVAAWGYNAFGQCTAPGGLAGVVAVEAGDIHSVALRMDGSVVCWGDNLYGQCNSPELSGVVQVCAQSQRTVVLLSDGTVRCWGRNDYGSCNVPASLGAVAHLGISGWENYALKSDGYVVSWPQGWANGIGGPDVVEISAGVGHFITLDLQGRIQCRWPGTTQHGQCDVPSLLPVLEIDSGAEFVVALEVGGSVRAWGNNGFGQCNVPTDLANVATISAGDRHVAVIVADPCPGDIFDDQHVNGADLGILLSQWGPNTPLTESDLNNDGVVNGADLGLLLSFWGACP